MKVKRLMLSLAAVALFAVVYGCVFGLSIQGRLDQFIDDLNSADRSNVYKNLDPSIPDYDELKHTNYWGDDIELA